MLSGSHDLLDFLWNMSLLFPLHNLLYVYGCHAGATEEQTAIRMRKEQYMQELQKQIAEQQRNKMR